MLHHLFRHLHRQRAVGRNLGGERLGRIKRRAFGNFVDQADLIGAFRPDEIAGQRQFQRDAFGDLIGQHHHAASSGHKPALHFGNPEFGVGIGDHQIAGDHQFQPACQRIAFDRRDQRLGGRGLHHAAKPAPFDAGAFAAQEAFQVHPRTECPARTSDDADAQIILGVQPIHRRRDSFGSRLGHRVFGFGTVDGDDQDTVFNLGQHFGWGILAHGCLPIDFSIAN